MGSTRPRIPKRKERTVSLTVYTGQETLVEKKCGTCGIWFAVPDWFEAEALRLGPRGSWTCPNGHTRHYREGQEEKNEIKRLNSRLIDAQAREAHVRDQLQGTENQLRAQKAAKTRLKNRIANGVCPSCKRHFTNVERHMKTKHPDYAKETK